jgi:Ca-activated chloride channel family protein
MIHFIRPNALFLLLLFIPAMLGLWFLLRGSSHHWRQVCDSHLLPYLSMTSTTSQRWPLWLLSVIGIIASIALAGPAWVKKPVPLFQSTQPTVFVVDLSSSMRAEDLKPSRIERVKYKLIDLLRQSNEGLIGLVVFSDTAFVVSPLTQDSQTIANFVPILEPGLLPVDGHHISTAISKAGELIKQGGMQHGHIVLMTDHVGSSEAFKEAEKCHQEVIDISVLAVGTAEGAPIPTPQGGFKKDAKGAMILSKLDLKSLQQLTDVGGGVTVTMTTDNQDVDNIIRQIHLRPWSDEVVQSKIEAQLWRDDGGWFILLLLPLVLVFFRRGIL